MPPSKNTELVLVFISSRDDLICKASDFRRLARFSLSSQQAIFHSPVLTVQYDYLVVSVVLGVKKMLLLNR